MNTIEICAVVIAAAAVVMAGASLVGLVWLGRIRRRLEATSIHASRALLRWNGIAANLDGMIRDARRVETRLQRTVEQLLDQVETPVRIVTSLVTVARTAFDTWMTRNGDRGAHRDPMESRGVPEGRMT